MDEQTTTNPCNPDDLACQSEVLDRLKDIQKLAKQDGFEQRYEHLAPLAHSIDELVEKQEQIVQDSVDACGLAQVEDVPAAEEQPEQDLSQYFTEDD